MTSLKQQVGWRAALWTPAARQRYSYCTASSTYPHMADTKAGEASYVLYLQEMLKVAMGDFFFSKYPEPFRKQPRKNPLAAPPCYCHQFNFSGQYHPVQNQYRRATEVTAEKGQSFMSICSLPGIKTVHIK